MMNDFLKNKMTLFSSAKNRKIAFLASIIAMTLFFTNSENLIVGADSVQTIDGQKYRISEDGENLGLLTGWLKRGGERYYYKNGNMLRSCWLRVKGQRTYYLRENGTMATGAEEIGRKIYLFSKSGKYSGRSYTLIGEAYTPEQIREVIECERRTIASYAASETSGANGDIFISLKGYNYLQIETGEIALDYLTLPIFTEEKGVIGEAVLFSYDGEIHYSVLAGGVRWEQLNRAFSEENGTLAFTYKGEFMERLWSETGDVFEMGSGEVNYAGKELYQKYAAGYNTFSFLQMKKEGAYVTVSPDERNIFLR